MAEKPRSNQEEAAEATDFLLETAREITDYESLKKIIDCWSGRQYHGLLADQNFIKTSRAQIFPEKPERLYITSKTLQHQTTSGSAKQIVLSANQENNLSLQDLNSYRDKLNEYFLKNKLAAASFDIIYPHNIAGPLSLEAPDIIDLVNHLTGATFDGLFLSETFISTAEVYYRPNWHIKATFHGESEQPPRLYKLFLQEKGYYHLSEAGLEHYTLDILRQISEARVKIGLKFDPNALAPNAVGELETQPRPDMNFYREYNRRGISSPR